jgi:hypothetical protein
LEKERLGFISNLVTDAGDGAGEAGRLDGLRNEGVLMVCIEQVLKICVVVVRVMVVITVAESLEWKKGWTVFVYTV